MNLENLNNLLAKVHAVKNISIFFIFNLFYSYALAQDVVLKKNRLTDSVTEHYYVLKSNEEIKNGSYEAFFKRKKYVAVGKFKNNEKIGIWQFFNKDGILVEKFDYDIYKFTFIQSVTSKNINFLFDDTIKATDKFTRPLKIGGEYYGFIPYLNIFKLPFETFELETRLFDAYVELLISPLGRLAWYKVYINSNYYDYHQSFSLDVNLFSDEEKTYLPATKNGVPVLSRIIIRCSINDDAGLDFYHNP